jgi:hypothetical protein
LFCIAALILFFGYKTIWRSGSFMFSWSSIIPMLGAVTGGILTYYLNVSVALGPVLAAGIVGTLISLVPDDQAKKLDLTAPVYCGAFVGMTAEAVADGFPFILLASLCAGVLYVLSQPFFTGVGGKLGTVAFAGVTVVSLFYFLAI